MVITTNLPERIKSGEIFQKGIAHAELGVMPVDGYHAAGTDPDVCARATLDFIARHTK